MAASIQITKQSSLFEEVLNKNGKDCNTFYYVKNTPFLITLSSNVSLAKAKVELEVVYWEDHRPVVVPFKQLDFIVHKTKEDVKSICLEVRLHVLSSQLENAIFALLISVDGFPNKITSNAFKVVSKHDQIKRRQEKAGANPEVEVRTTPAKRKRSGGEEVIGNLDDIKENIAQQTQMLNQVLELLQQQQSSTQQKNQHTQTINKRRKINDDSNNTNNNNTSDNAKDVVYTLEIEDLKNQLMKANKRILELEVEVETLKLTNQNLQQTTQIFDKINSEMIMDMDQQASEWGHVHHHHHHHADSATDEDSH